MIITIEISEQDLKKLILQKVIEETGSSSIRLPDIKILVKSKQNYKSEWEEANFKATCEVITP